MTLGVQTTLAVLDSGGHVVVLLEGRDAVAAADDWAALGYRVEVLPESAFANIADVA